MAEETIDLIEESNGEIESWVYYNNEPETPESTDMNSFTYVDADQLLMHTDNDSKNDGSRDQAEQLQDIVADTSEHNLILKEVIDENGQLVEEYLCQSCNMSFKSIEEFLDYHPFLHLLSEKPEEEEERQQHDVVPTATENKLWDLVENLDEAENEDIIEIKPNITQHDDSSQEKEASNNTVELDKEHYFCYDCQQVFMDLTTAENHECDDHLQISNEIPKAKSTLQTDNDNDDNNVYRCHICDKDYTSLRSFNNHQRWHKKSENLLGYTKTLNDEPAVCEICNTIFASEKNLKLHMKMHKKHTPKTIQDALPVGAQNEYNNLNQFFCEICNKSFDQKLLMIHKNMHQNLEEYSCGKCNKQFENLPSYEIHMHMHEDNDKNSNTVRSVSERNIVAEVPSASAEGGKRKHACQYCGKEFQRPYEKVKHERIHTGEKPYECEVCGKTFRVSYSLTLHLRTHTDIRPYVCATCNKRFKQQSVYMHHLKIHMVECGYKCNICGKSFRTSVQLGGHKNIHSKPYNCTDCNRPFASLYAVKIHMKTHNKSHKSNKNLKNRCNICGASYARALALSLHIKEQHDINVDPAKLLPATSSNANTDAETNVLINAADEASNQQMNFINVEYEEDNDGNESTNEDVGIFGSQVDHEENIQNSLPNNFYIDEAEAATQNILNTEDGIFRSQIDHEENIENSLPNNLYIDETEAATQTILNTEDGVFDSQVDHDENIQNSLQNNVYIDETEAATQAILNTEEISVDNFPTEEIITDWYSK